MFRDKNIFIQLYTIIVMLFVFCLTIPAYAQGVGQSIPKQNNNRMIFGLKVSKPGDPLPKFARPQQGGAISGTGFEFAVYVDWQQGYVDPNGLDWIELYVSGTDLNNKPVNERVAAHYFALAPLPHPAWWTIGARIDTTNFLSGSSIKIRAVAQAVDYNDYIITPSKWEIKVNNSLFEVGNNDLRVNGGKDYTDETRWLHKPIDKPYLYPTGAIKVTGSIGGLDKSTILTAIPHHTAFIAVTHGNVGNISDWFGLPSPAITPDAHILYASDVVGAVANKTANDPPYTFIYLSACDVFGNHPTGQPDDDRMATAFLEGSTNSAFAPLPSKDSLDNDRAAVGFDYTIYCDPDSSGFGGGLIHDMAYHYRTLSDARLFAYKEHKPNVLLAGDPSNPSKVGKAWPIIFGDETMTLRGVYNPPVYDGKTNFWYVQDVDTVYTGPR